MQEGGSQESQHPPEGTFLCAMADPDFAAVEKRARQSLHEIVTWMNAFSKATALSAFAVVGTCKQYSGLHMPYLVQMYGTLFALAD